MRMHISPGSLWIAYTLTKPAIVHDMMPPSLELSACKLLKDDRTVFPTPKLLFNVYKVESPWMHGMRVDVLTLAKHKNTNTHHLVLLDCLSDTLQWTPEQGVYGPNCFFFRNNCGSLIAKDYTMAFTNSKGRFALAAKQDRIRPIDWTFAVQANLACYYKNYDMPFLMSFNHSEIMQPVRDLIPMHISNTFWSECRSQKESHLFYHEHAMDFDVDVVSFAKQI